MTWINKCRKAAVTHALENDLSWRDLTLSNFIWRRGVWAGRQLERRKVKWLLISFLFFFFNMYRQHARHQGCICGSQLGLYIRIIQGGFQEKCLGHALRDSDEIAWERDPGICNSINIIHHGQAGFISGMKRFFSICWNQSVWYITLTNWRIKSIGSSQSVQVSHSVVSDSLWSHGLQHSRLPCPSPTPRVCSNSCPLSQWWKKQLLMKFNIHLRQKLSRKWA